MTWTVTVVVWLRPPPLMPVMVRLRVPRAVDELVVTVSVEGADDGDSWQVAFVGHPVTLSPTGPVKPLVGETVTV